MSAYVPDTSFISRRAFVLIGIITFHILVIYIIASGIGSKVVQVVAPQPIDAVIINDQPHDEPPPQPPQPQFDRPQVEIPPPLVTLAIPTDPPTAITNATSSAVPTTTAPAARSRAVIHAKGSFPSPDAFYPDISIRLAEEGSATVRTCVAPNGKLAEPPTILRSSKSARLDDAALKLARASRFTAGTIDGIATTDCFNFLVTFKLTKK